MNIVSAPQQQPAMALSPANRLKLLSYNAQVGIGSASYRDYVTQSWRHILPHSRRHRNMSEIASWLSDYDIVALQEVDAGSLRTNFINQVAFLAEESGFPHWFHQQNRQLGRFAAHSNGILSKLPAFRIRDHKLPGRITGRGALQAGFGESDQQLVVMSVHLALSPQARQRQLTYLSHLLKQLDYFVIMGDMNCSPAVAEAEFLRHDLDITIANRLQPTFPRWNPKHRFDQIWVSKNIEIVDCRVMDLGVSDHLPIAIELALPDNLVAIKQSATVEYN